MKPIRDPNIVGGQIRFKVIDMSVYTIHAYKYGVLNELPVSTLKAVEDIKKSLRWQAVDHQNFLLALPVFR